MGTINNNLQTSNTMRAKPFLKWAGGKNQLLTQFEQLYPRGLHNRKITNYVEPFIGGGAVFFDLMQRFNFKNAYISDINVDLILTYQVVQNKVEQLISSLKEYQNNYNQLNEEKRLELFLNIREQFNQRKVLNKPSVEIATQLIFLNKTCFNGLFRLNSKGGFNVPFGKYANPAILQEANLRLVSNVLQNVEIKAANYDACFDKVDSNTLVYFDPPYRPLSKTANFTSYAGNEFGDKEQKQLATFFQRLHKEKNAKVMLSNSDPKNENINDDFFENIYSNFDIHRVKANRAINSNAEKRGEINEIIITNYKVESALLQLNF